MILPLLKTALEPVVQRQRNLRLMKRVAICWAVFAALAAILLSTGGGGRMWAGLIALAAAVAVLFIRKQVHLWEPDYVAIARRIEERHPKLHALLLTAVEQRPDPKTRQLTYLQQRVVADAVLESRKHQWLDSVPNSHLAGATIAQFATLALMVALLFGLVRTTSTSTKELAQRAEAKSNEEVTVTPGDAEIERGSGLIVLARFEKEVPSEATLVLNPQNAPEQRIALVKNLDDPVFGGGLPEVTTDLRYRVEYAGKKTRDFTVKVFEYPRLDRADVVLHYPEFTKLPDKEIPDTRRVSAVQGSTLDVTFRLNKPVAKAELVDKEGNATPLVLEPGKAEAGLRSYAVQESKSWELRLEDADGRKNKIPAQFVLEALENRQPELKFAAPKGDQRVTPIQEIGFHAEAWDDFGITAAGVSYSVAGGETKEFALVKSTQPDERVKFEQLLALEELNVKADELISWYLWADDFGADGKPRRTVSDMFFAEVRPFEEIFRPGQGGEQEAGNQQQQGGGVGGQAEQQAASQKEIISATWNIKRAEDANTGPQKPSEKYVKDLPVVREAQAEALQKAEAMKEQTEDARTLNFIENVTKEMKNALDQLDAAAKSPDALPNALAAEQAAYNALLKLAAHEFRVQRQRNQTSQGQQQNQDFQAQLDQLEMREDENRYETQSEANPLRNEEQREQLAVLNRLKELAQRQQDINERLKELQTALQEAQTEKEKEEVERELKRLREQEQQMLADMDELQQKMEQPENQSRFAEERRQLEQTRREAQQAAESMERGETSRALAEGTRAERNLEEMRDELRKRTSSQFREDMRQMRADARELAERQEKIAEQLNAPEEGPQRRTLDGSGPRERLAQEFEKQQGQLQELREQMKRVSSAAEAAEPLLSRQLYDTLRENTQVGTDESLRMAGELSRLGYNQQAQKFEEKARAEVEKLKEGVEKAAESVLGDEAEALRLARQELDEASEALNRELAQARPDLAMNDAASRQNQRGRRSDDREGERTPGEPGERNPDQQRPGGQRDGEQARAPGAQGENQQPGEAQRSPGEGNRENSQAGEGRQPSEQRENQPGRQRGQGSGQERSDEQGEQNAEGRNPQGGQPGQGREGQNPQEGQPGKGQEGENPEGLQPGQGRQGQGGRQLAQGRSPSEQGDRAEQERQERSGQSGQRGEGRQGRPGENQEPSEDQQPSNQEQSEQSRMASGRGGQGGNAQQGRNDSDTDANRAEQDPSQRNAQRGLRDLAAPRQRGVRDGGRETANGTSGGGVDSYDGPLTGENFVEWSDRLRNVEEMLDSPELRREVARVREAAKGMRAEFKRHGEEPKWELVRTQIGEPLAELRNRITEELARRETKDSLVPIDRDPVPTKYADRVRRYYEDLGRSR